MATDQNPWVIRTDHSSDQVWEYIKKQVSSPQKDPLTGMEFTANVRFVEDRTMANLPYHDIVHALPSNYPGFVVFVVDAQSIHCKDHSLLVLGFSPLTNSERDFERTPNQTPLGDIMAFRAIPSCIQAIENNLSIANMDFDDFSAAVDRDGVFRGFP